MAFVLFLVAIPVVGVAGVLLIDAAEKITRRTRIGQAVMGAFFVGAITSLSGITTSVTAAATGYPSLAISNAIGGIAIQTVFIVVADFFYKRGNLEHFAASETTVIQGALLVIMLALPLLALALPPVALWGIHPISFAMVIVFVVGMRMTSNASLKPAWKPIGAKQEGGAEKGTSDEGGAAPPLFVVWGLFGVSAGLVALSGLVLAVTAPLVADGLGISETAVGGFLTAIPTSLPELVTAIAAVRRGALVLAVSDILGGNCFDVLFLAFSDAAYQAGSIYHVIQTADIGFVGLGLVLTGILLLGLLRREKNGVGKIGFEGWFILGVYGVTAGFLASA